jgi:hypothetical protein
MKTKIYLLSVLFLPFQMLLAQTAIQTKKGIRYITTDIGYPLTGTYYFKGAEPIVELGAGGNGFYQLHDQPKRAVNWGIECDQGGDPVFKKGFDNAAYTLWYRYTYDGADGADGEWVWTPVEFTIHFKSQKMFIQGERCKSYAGDAERNPEGK